MVSDKGSHNGTTLDGVKLLPGVSHVLNRGCRLTFGYGSECWLLVDDSPPNVMAVCGDGTILTAEDGVIGIPSQDQPVACIFKGADGEWRLEHGEEPMLTLENGTSFEVEKQRWRFCQPDAVMTTSTTEELATSLPTRLHFRVSADEEYVELEQESGAETASLGHRSHNYLLLTLARARLSDMERGLSESSCGWQDKHDLAAALRMTPQQIDVEIFRIRKHFGHHGLPGAVIVERRPRARQVRIGVADLFITRI